MIKLLKYFKWTEWLIIMLILGFIAGQVYLDLSLPGLMEKIIIKIYASSSNSSIWATGGIMLVTIMGSVLLSMMVTLLSSFIAARFAVLVRGQIFAKINSFSMEEINKFSTASLITRSTNDITQMQTTIGMFFRMAIYSPAMAIGAILEITGRNITLSAITGGAIVAMFALVFAAIFIVIPSFIKLQKQTDKINLVTRENLTGIRVVRAYNAEKAEEDKFDKINNSMARTNMRLGNASSVLMPGMQFIIMGLSLAILWVGAGIVKGNPAFYAELTVFSQYGLQVLMSFMLMTMFFIMLPRGIVSARRVNAVFKEKVKITDGITINNKKTKQSNNIIEFKNVNFCYPDAQENVLKNINIKVKPGQTVAIIGSTGSGKSTLVNLITRFYDVTNGELLIDGQNVKDYKLSELYAKIGYVPQKGVLFSGTIEDNIKFGKNDATEDEVAKALEIAQATEFVENFENKTHHYISQGGKNVSGGQKQRLSIARAIVRNPEIYIFDDSFSALDYKTDRKLRMQLKKQVRGSTCIIVAQRIGTVLNADQIIVMENGEVMGIGTHKQLMNNCVVYQEIALSQLSKEELANAKD